MGRYQECWPGEVAEETNCKGIVSCSYKLSIVISSSLSLPLWRGAICQHIAGCQQNWETPRKGIPELWRPWSLGHRKSCLCNFPTPKQGGPGSLGSLRAEELVEVPAAGGHGSCCGQSWAPELVSWDVRQTTEATRTPLPSLCAVYLTLGLDPKYQEEQRKFTLLFQHLGG